MANYCSKCGTQTMLMYGTIPEKEANIQLCEAAPELLKALQELHETTIHWTNQGSSAERDHFKPFLDNSLKAILKALK